MIFKKNTKLYRIKDRNSALTSSSDQSQNYSLIEIRISPKRVARFLGFIVLGLILTSTLGTISHEFLSQDIAQEIGRLLYVDAEANIPSTYSSWSLLLCSIILAVIAIVESKGSYSFHWKSLSLIFFYLSIDEAVMLHESTIPKIGRWLLPSFNLSGFLSFAWVIFGAAFVLVFLLIYWRFVFSLPNQTKFLFMIAGIIYITGAIGVECIGGWYADLYGYKNHIYSTIATFEEALEMIGILVFIYALLQHINLYLPSIKIHIKGQKKV